MSTADECISKVQALIEQQLQLLNLSLFICDKGSADFSNEDLVCALSEEVRTVVVPMSLAGGQSIGTILFSAASRRFHRRVMQGVRPHDAEAACWSN